MEFQTSNIKSFTCNLQILSDQTSSYKQNGQSTWWLYMVASIFIYQGSMWAGRVNILTKGWNDIWKTINGKKVITALSLFEEEVLDLL